jgi:osomolarity two-component system phosphorelay intermediate protein YPD1
MATTAAHIIEDPVYHLLFPLPVSSTYVTEQPFNRQAEDSRLDLTGYEDCIDQPTFEQILEMDDNQEREFSRGIVYGFFDQAESTFVKMENAM